MPLRRLATALLAAAMLICGAASSHAAPTPAQSFGKWQPTRFDSCPVALHDRFATKGPDGKLYPTWHPPVVTDPATGKRCTFGHEHGRNPRGSDLYRWVSRHLGGLPFGAANEALDAYAAANPAVTPRHEDHVGHKVEWQNDVRLERRAGAGRRRRIGVSCDYLTKVHQGSHSADAFSNNVHELIYAARCTDGTALIATTLARFARPNLFARGCDPSVEVSPPTALLFPAGRGSRLIPDRACIDRNVLVSPGRLSLLSRGLYENWSSSNALVTANGRPIARWDPHFAVFNPARYYDPTQPNGLARTVDVCWERTATGERASGSACDLATDYGRRAPISFEDPRSPFDGTHRETIVNQTRVSNRRGLRRWFTDPYGRRASSRPFPGALCQLVSRTDNSRRPTVAAEAFGAERPYARRSVHAPN